MGASLGFIAMFAMGFGDGQPGYRPQSPEQYLGYAVSVTIFGSIIGSVASIPVALITQPASLLFLNKRRSLNLPNYIMLNIALGLMIGILFGTMEQPNDTIGILAWALVGSFAALFCAPVWYFLFTSRKLPEND